MIKNKNILGDKFYPYMLDEVEAVDVDMSLSLSSEKTGKMKVEIFNNSENKELSLESIIACEKTIVSRRWVIRLFPEESWFERT